MMDKSNDGQMMVRIRDCEIFKTNFAGLEERRDGRIVNNEGARYFLIWLDPEDAKELEADNWRVKWTKPRPDSDADYQPRAYMKVAVSYPVNYPKLHPKIVLISGHSKKNIFEDTVEQIDHEDIIKVNVELRGRHNPDTGLVNAYASTLYVTIKEDPFASEYEDYED